MNNPNAIEIMRAANGYIVMLPRTESSQPFLPPEYFDKLEEIGKKIRGTDVLEDIQDRQKKKSEKPKKSFALPSDDTMFIFSTFEEVIEFLAQRF